MQRDEQKREQQREQQRERDGQGHFVFSADGVGCLSQAEDDRNHCWRSLASHDAGLVVDVLGTLMLHDERALWTNMLHALWTADLDQEH
jgi:hypothetical protein